MATPQIQTNTDYDNNSNVLGTLLSPIANDYKFLYFQPDSTSGYPTEDIGCHAPTEYNPNDKPINMVPINAILGTTKLHTNESCKLNAALLQSKNKWTEQNAIKNWPASNIKNGLNVNKVVGYMSNNVKFFLGKNVAQKNVTTDFTSASNTNNTSAAYSVEWYGFFKPNINKPGLNGYTFTINSTSNIFMWIGDIAVNDYTYATAQIKTGINQIYEFPCLYNRLYPIRIQCGFKTSGDTFSLTIKDPNRLSVNPKDVFFTYYNADGSIFEKAMMYYSLTDSGNPGLYNCYVSTTDTPSILQLKNNPNGYKYTTVWQLILDSDPVGSIISSNILKYIPSQSATNTLSICSPSGQVKKSLQDPSSKIDSNITRLSLSDSGVLSGGSTAIFTATTSADAIQNNDWAIYAESNNIPASIDFASQGITWSSGTVLLISPGAKYKLEFLGGNLLLKQSTAACTTKTSGATAIHYAPLTDNNSYYLYRVDADEKMDKMFMASKNSQTLVPIPYGTENGFTLSRNDSDFINYDSYFPSDTTGEKNLSTLSGASTTIQTCQAMCAADTTCNYVYQYKKTGDLNTYCLPKSDTRMPTALMPKQPGSNIATSSLYVRNYQPAFPAGDARTKIGPTTVTPNYTSYQDYQLMVDKPFVLNDQYKIGYNGLDKDLRNRLIINHNYIKGRGQPVGQNPIAETFDNAHGYVPGNTVRQATGNPGDTDNLPNRIKSNQITPLGGIATDYSTLLDKINDKHDDIKNNISTYATNLTNVTYDTTSTMNAENEKKRSYDFNKDTLAYNSNKPTIQDAINQDLNILILQENQLYMLSAVTIAALLVGAIYFGRE